jgi:hypothetical protein
MSIEGTSGAEISQSQCNFGKQKSSVYALDCAVFSRQTSFRPVSIVNFKTISRKQLEGDQTSIVSMSILSFR